MLSQQDQEMRRNVPDPLYAGGSHYCGSERWRKAIITLAPELRTKLHPYEKDIVVKLQAKEGLSETDVITITSQANPIDKVDKLLDRRIPGFPNSSALYWMK